MEPAVYLGVNVLYYYKDEESEPHMMPCEATSCINLYHRIFDMSLDFDHICRCDQLGTIMILRFLIMDGYDVLWGGPTADTSRKWLFVHVRSMIARVYNSKPCHETVALGCRFRVYILRDDAETVGILWGKKTITTLFEPFTSLASASESRSNFVTAKFVEQSCVESPPHVKRFSS